MRLVNFTTVEGKNFLSFGDNPIKATFRSGVNAIIGTNLDKEDSKNGAGKSTVTELLYYALYGTTLREISKDHIQNSITKKRCEISLEFSVTVNNKTDNYKIIRKLNPTKCILLKNGEDTTRSTLAKTNELIHQLIRTPAAVFRNSIIMSANNALPFMALSKTDKRKFVESVLGLEIFTDMVLKARDDFSIAKKDYEIAYTKYEQQQNELLFNQSQYDNYEISRKEKLEKLQEKKLTIETEIDQLSDKIVDVTTEDFSYSQDQVDELNKQIASASAKLQSYGSNIIKADAEINSENKQIASLKHNKDSCPTCSREYSEEHVLHVQELINKHIQNIEKYESAKIKLTEAETQQQTAIDKLQADIKHHENKREKREQARISNNNILTSLKFLSQNLEDVKENILIITNEQNNDLKGKLALLKAQTEETKDSVDKLNNELNILESVKFVISEEGIKSFLVKKILKVLNSRLAFYLKKLEANCLCRFNEFFDEEIIDEKSTPKSYFNFSGGERKRIDLACLFAFADVRRLQGDVNFNTVFYDELLDSSLDDRGVQLTLRALRERFNEIGESCYIITHRGPEVTTKAEHIIHAIKKNGITELSC
jgi:DNA repair exonuclease SbcCD ATPase subunit